VSESWFYKWRDRSPTASQARRAALDAAVKESLNGTSIPPLDDMQWHVDADSGIKPRSTDRALGTWVVAVSAGLGVAERAFVAVGAR
jgi:hypothetical protein